MAEDIISIALALDTSQILSGTRQVDTALRQVQAASTSTAQATKQVDQASRAAGQAMQTESQAAGQAAQALGRLDQAAAAAGRQMGTLSSTLGSFGQQVGAFALAQAGVLGFQQALSTAQRALEDVVRTGIQMSQLRGSFAAIAGGVTAGNREFKFAVDTANRLGLEVKSVAEQYRSLTAATRGTSLAGQDTRALFVALSNAAQAYGLSTEQLGRAMTAFQQIISKGKVSQEELRQQLSEAIPGAVQIAARAFGTTTTALETMIEKGIDATDFVRRFTTQLQTETPAAAERAGKGIQQFGNEIFMLKDRIAQSGVLKFLDDILGKLGAIGTQLRTNSEELAAANKRTATRALGGEDPSKMPQGNVAKLLDVSEQLNQADERLRAAQARLATAREQAAGRGTFTQGVGVEARAVNVAQQQADALRKQQTELANVIKLEETRRKQTLENSKLLTEMDEQYGAQVRAQERDKAAEPGRITDRFKEIQGRTEGQIKDQEAADERAKKSAQDRETATRKADQARKEREREEQATADKEVQRLRELGAADDRAMEQLRRLAAQYTEVKTTRDEDTASMLAASLQTSQYAKESRELADAIADVQRIEAKLPALRSEAAGSAERLTNITRAMQQFEPRRRGESTEERLTRSYTDLAQEPGVSMGKLSEASEKIRDALDTEMWDKWRDVGLSALDHVGDALADFALKGKLTFKDMLGAIADDLFRFSMQTLMQSATKKGGWLEVGLDFGLKALGIAGGFAGGMPGSGTLPTTEAAYTAQAAAGRFSGRQHGGPVSAGVPYMVGEGGKAELFVPRTSGTIVPAGQAQAPINVVNNFHITTPDANSFTQSRGAISRSIMHSITQARQQ